MWCLFFCFFYQFLPEQFAAFCKQFCKVNNLVMGSLPTRKLMMLSSGQLTAPQTNCSIKNTYSLVGFSGFFVLFFCCSSIKSVNSLNLGSSTVVFWSFVTARLAQMTNCTFNHNPFFVFFFITCCYLIWQHVHVLPAKLFIPHLKCHRTLNNHNKLWAVKSAAETWLIL